MYFLGIDISTTATKALLVDNFGRVVATASSEYDFETPRPLWSEQPPAVWWEGTQSSIRRLLKESKIEPTQIKAVGLTGQMHGLVILDAAGEVLRPCILWNDQRTQSQCEAIYQVVERENFIRLTGNPALTGFTLPKLLWVRENEPLIYNKIKHVLLPKDTIRYMLTGDFAMDVSDGSGTVMMDLESRNWSHRILDLFEIPLDWLPRVFEGPEPTGRIHARAAAAAGLVEGTLVVAGAGDQAAQAVGVGAVREGTLALTLGTSGVVFATSQHPYSDPDGRLHSFCHAVPGRWHLMGVMLSAAGSLRWFRDTFTPGRRYDELLAPCAGIPAGADGLLYLPYLTGERTPHPDPFARGAFVGLTVRHKFPHLTRAVLEGVAFGLRDSFELIKARGLGKIEQVRLSGGGARSQLWRQILASVLNTELATVSSDEGAAYGAALLAGSGARNWQDVETACQQAVVVTGLVEPSGELVREYEQLYQNYRGLYPALKPTFDTLA